MFIQYFSILTALTAVFAIPPHPNPKKREEEVKPAGGPITLQLSFEDYSYFENKTDKSDFIWGTSENKTITWWQESDYKKPQEFIWRIYNATGDKTNLQDKDKRYELNCTAQLVDGYRGGDSYTVLLNDKPPYIHALDPTVPETIVNIANVYCHGNCSNTEQCKGYEIPDISQTYLENYAKPNDAPPA